MYDVSSGGRILSLEAAFIGVPEARARLLERHSWDGFHCLTRVRVR